MGAHPKKIRYDQVLHPKPTFNIKGRPIQGMSPISVPPDVNEMLEREALEIFTLTVNSGRTFQEALASILITGMDWGRNSTPKETS